MLTLAISAGLGMTCFVVLIAVIHVYEDHMDVLDRLAAGGLAGSFLLTTPALFWPTPFDSWSFNLSRLFLTVIIVKRYGVPMWWAWAGRKRQRRQIAESGARLTDRLRSKL